ncbi:hypothetical protein [Symbioplanes lichenis]|uniref:hypothetical protein n=1 Tax=Symbioplanes lichenis TaxID=1629072 RepID=UPI0027389A6D|nr:hypothetical protein [Actinoplanes lichenis]
MTTTDELRRALDRGAGTASDGAGMADRVRAGAHRIRRRRRVTAVAVSASLVLAAGLAVTRLRTEPPAPPAAPAYREPGRLTVRPAAGSKSVWQQGFDGTMQWLMPSEDGTRRGDVVIRVFDPGSYDATALRKGERVSVGGQPAFWAYTPVEATNGLTGARGTVMAATVGWQDGSGAWVTVADRKAADRTDGLDDPAGVRKALIEAAGQVRLGPPQGLGVPVHFPAVADDLPMTFADITRQRGNPIARLGFGAGPVPDLSVGFARGPVPDDPLEVTVWTVGKVNWKELTGDPVNTTVADRPARYYERNDHLGVPPGGSLLLIEAGTCGLEILVRDRTRITRADLETMLTGATVDDCTSTTSWTEPVS